MNKRDAIKLRPGDIVLYGPSMWSEQCIGRTREGTVKHVTPKGGILVVDVNGYEHWVPYHHVLEAMRRKEENPKMTDLEKAKEIIADRLARGFSVRAEEIKGLCAAHGIDWDTAKAARKELGNITSWSKTKYNPVWYWKRATA